jgi:hypothetical protein
MDPESEISEPEIQTEEDLSGTAPKSILPIFSNFHPFKENMPQSDMGGEITPKSYDVRANSVMQEPSAETVGEQSSQQSPGFWSIIGKALSDYINPEKKAETQANLKATQEKFKEPIVNPLAQQEEFAGAPPPESSPGIIGAVKDYFNPTKRSQMAEHNKDLMQNAKISFQGGNPQEVRAQKEQELNQNVEKAMENPWQYAAYGSAEQVANNPDLQAQFREITGIDYEPQIADQVADYEAAMKGIEDEYNGIQSHLTENEERIKQRILNNQSTDSDKYYMGIALALPLLIGGFFGAEAG